MTDGHYFKCFFKPGSATEKSKYLEPSEELFADGERIRRHYLLVIVKTTRMERKKPGKNLSENNHLDFFLGPQKRRQR